jgi:hypothetical protein
MASDEVTDSIALIEMHRQEAQKEAGLAAACSEALRKLNELLAQEQEALKLNGTGNLHSANIEAVTQHIQRVQKLAGGGGGGGGGRGQGRSAHGRNNQQQQQANNNRGGPGRSRNFSRNKRRRSKGRHNER